MSVVSPSERYSVALSKLVCDIKINLPTGMSKYNFSPNFCRILKLMFMEMHFAAVAFMLYIIMPKLINENPQCLFLFTMGVPTYIVHV